MSDVNEETAKDEPAFQSNSKKRAIIASYWLIVLIALPLWWHTTSIERLSLPSSKVHGQVEKNLRFNISIVVECLDGWFNCRRIRDELGAELKQKARARPDAWKSLDIRLYDEKSLNVPRGAYHASLGVSVGPTKLTVSDRSLVLKNRGPIDAVSELANVLESLLQPSTPNVQELRVAQYAPRYRLSFTLLNEDASFGGAAIAWDVEDAIHRYMSDALGELGLLHNFTIESQVQFHAPLAFEPSKRNISGQDVYVLDQDQLKVFINSAEWTLSSSVSNDPVLHFLLFIPSLSRRPLSILSNDESLSNSNAFILPQWGGIVISNPPPQPDSRNIILSSSDLAPAFSLFRSQLYALLGVPSLPASVPPKPSLTGWQKDALMRQRILENTKGSTEALNSIVNLADRMQNMPIGQDVKGDVISALEALDKVHSPTPSLNRTLLHSAEALMLSSRAFFNPGMVAMLYFPAEHQYAVYTPLFAPVAVPLVVAVLKEFVTWRKKRKEKQKRD